MQMENQKSLACLDPKCEKVQEKKKVKKKKKKKSRP